MAQSQVVDSFVAARRGVEEEGIPYYMYKQALMRLEKKQGRDTLK